MKLLAENILIEPSISGGAVVRFETLDIKWNHDIMHKYDGKKMTVEIKEKRAGRSLDANAYYQVLVRKCAEAYGLSSAEYHNRSLAEVGIPWLDSEDKVSYVLMKDNDEWLKVLQGGSHYAPTEATEIRKGVQYRWFYLLLPSRFMDSKQMATLIDYVVQDAKTLGIETLEDEKIDQLVKEWEAKH